MKTILIQAGHEGRTSGSTGAPSEQSFNIDISNQVAFELSKMGFDVRRVNADPLPDEIGGDWDLFLAIHYDSDVYDMGGGFVDFPYPETDNVTTESQRIAYLLRQEYFGTTHIVSHPERSNKNTKGYYMWAKLSAKTPCVIIECGVGMHVPDDHSVLHFNRPLVVEGIVKGICLAFNVPYIMPETPGIPTPPSPVYPDLSMEVTTLKKTIEQLNSEINIHIGRIADIRSIIYDKWTWTGVRGWKNRLTQLRALLP